MGQLFAATSAKHHSCDDEEHSGNVMIDDKQRDAESDWYMNKILKFKPIKVLASSGGCDQPKTRSMIDLVKRSKEKDLSGKELLSAPSYLNETSGLLSNVDVYQDRPVAGIVQTCESDEELEKMTLKEMHRRLKKSLKGSLESKSKINVSSSMKPSSDGLASVVLLKNTVNNSIMPTSNFISSIRETHVSQREWLVAHTCNNNVITKNETVPHVLMNTCQIKTEITSEDTFEYSERDVASKNRSFDDLTSDKPLKHENIEDDDDAMTLGMWQSHKKKKMSSKKKKKHDNPDVVCSLSGAEPAICSLNAALNPGDYGLEGASISGCTQIVSLSTSLGGVPSGTTSIEGDCKPIRVGEIENRELNHEVVNNEADVNKRESNHEDLSNIENEVSTNIDIGVLRKIDDEVLSKISCESSSNISIARLSNNVNQVPSDIGCGVLNKIDSFVLSNNDNKDLNKIDDEFITRIDGEGLSDISNQAISKLDNGGIDYDGLININDKVSSNNEGPNMTKHEVLGNLDNEGLTNLENECLSNIDEDDLRNVDVNHLAATNPEHDDISMICSETIQLQSLVHATDLITEDDLLQGDEVKQNAIIKNYSDETMIENREWKTMIEDSEHEVIIDNSKDCLHDTAPNSFVEPIPNVQLCEPCDDTEKYFENTGDQFNTSFLEQNQGIESVNHYGEAASPIDTYTSETYCNEETSPIDLYSTEKLGVEMEQHHSHAQPSKIPRKRKAISPLSREKLIKASKLSDEDVMHRGIRKLPRSFKCYIGRDNFNQELLDVNAWTKGVSMNEISPTRKYSQKEDITTGSPCHKRQKSLFSNTSSSKCSPPMTVQEDLSLVLNSSPSPPPHQPANSNSMLKVSPLVPAKGILRSASPSCKGACRCDECASLRLRAERAAEFSQQQMHDIEGLTVKLLKELNTMRGVLEETLVHGGLKSHSPRSVRCLDKARIVANNAVEAEKMAKTWLVRMARDCNRYCKIMRMQERKLTFADESGGQLCQVKLFRSKTHKQPSDSTSVDFSNSSIGGSTTSEIATISVSEAIE